MSGRCVKIGARHRRWVHAVLACVYATGIAWMALHYAVNRGEGLEDGWRAAESWVLRAHGAAAMAALVVFGSMLTAHVPSAWRLGRSLGSGSGLLASLALFAATGWLLYYAAGDAVRAWSSYAHMGIGVVSPLALAWHLAQRNRSAPAGEIARDC